jgi:hypothetical protein
MEGRRPVGPEEPAPGQGAVRGALAVGLLILVVACSQQSADDLAVWFERMTIPAHWELVSEELTDPPCPVTESCPEAQRVYRSTADPAFVEDAARMMEAAGLRTSRTPSRGCNEEVEGCRVLGWRENPDDVSVTATVSQVDGDTMTISVRIRRSVGPPPSE